jgi:N-acetylglucosamine-1-phosphodiester alpha-N-acetylglucosaminidase
MREKKFGIYSHETWKASTINVSKAMINHKRFSFKDKNNQIVNGHFMRLDNPINHFSFLEPLNGCGNGAETVTSSSKSKNNSIKLDKCKYSTNAGFFNIFNFNCLGNVISNSRRVQMTPVVNANFGITKDGIFYTGYLDIHSVNRIPFTQLIGGVIWLVRNRQNYVEQSVYLEEMSTQTSGNGTRFVNLKASRIGIGHDEEGRLMIISVDGLGSVERGVNLNELSDIMIKYGAVNAINLDGGGSVSVVSNNELVNYPSDTCKTESVDFKCERKVTTITCVFD